MKKPHAHYALRRAPSGTWLFENYRVTCSIGIAPKKVNSAAAGKTEAAEAEHFDRMGGLQELDHTIPTRNPLFGKMLELVAFR